jgi:hypothetical protein
VSITCSAKARCKQAALRVMSPSSLLSLLSLLSLPSLSLPLLFSSPLPFWPTAAAPAATRRSARVRHKLPP